MIRVMKSQVRVTFAIRVSVLSRTVHFASHPLQIFLPFPDFLFSTLFIFRLSEPGSLPGAGVAGKVIFLEILLSKKGRDQPAPDRVYRGQ
jgi:hypothetical protein